MIRVILDRLPIVIPPQAFAQNEVGGKPALYFADADEAAALSLGGEVFRARDRDPDPPPMPPPVPPAVPPRVATNAQIRVALIRRGVDPDAVAQVLASIPDQVARREALAVWDYEPFLRRDHDLVEVVRAARGWTESQVDELFSEARGIVS